MSTIPIVLSEVAADRLKDILSEGKYKAIRFSMQQTAQGNLAPSMFLVDEVPEGDMLYSERGVSVLMDKETAEVLEGAEVDLVKEGEDEHFVLTNAMASGCGCGCGSETGGGSCGCGCGDSAGAEPDNA